MGKSKCESNVGKRRCRRRPIKNTACCHSHTHLKSKETCAAVINPHVNVLIDEDVGEGRRYCRRCHQSTDINVLTDTNMCVACVYKLERFIKDYYCYQAELRKKETLSTI